MKISKFNSINSLLKADYVDLKEEISDDDLEVGPEDDGKSGSEAFMQQIKKELEDCGYTDIEFRTKLYPRRKWAEWYDGESTLFTLKRGNVTIKVFTGEEDEGLKLTVATSTINPNVTKNIYYVSELEDEGIVDDESFRTFIREQQDIYHNDELFDDSYIYIYFSYYGEDGGWLNDSFEFGWDDCSSLTDIINSLKSTDSIDEDIANMIEDGKLDNSEVPESKITESIDDDMLDSSYESKEVEITDEELDDMYYDLKSKIKLIRDKNIEGYEIDDTNEEIDNLKFYVSKNANGKDVKYYLHRGMFDVAWPYVMYDSKDRVWLGFTEDYLRIEAPTVYERLIGKIEEEIEDDMIETSSYSDSAEEYINKNGSILPMKVKEYIKDKYVAWEGNSLNSDWILVYDSKYFHNNEDSDYYLDSIYADSFQDLDDQEDTNYVFIERLPNGEIREICYLDNRYTKDILRDSYGKTDISKVTFNDFINEEIEDDMLEVISKEEVETLKNKKVKLDRSKDWVKKYLNNLIGIDYLDRDEDFSALDFYIKRNYDGRSVKPIYSSCFWSSYPFMLVDNRGRVWDGMEKEWINERIEDSSVREEILNLPDVSGMLDGDTVNEDIDSNMIDTASLDDLYDDIYKLDTKNLFRGEGNRNHLIYYIRANRMPTKKEVTERIYPFQGSIDPEDFVNEITHIRYSELPPEYKEVIEENPKCIFEGHNPNLASSHNNYFDSNSSADSDSLVIKTMRGFEPVVIKRIGQTKMSLYINHRLVSWVNVSDTGYIYYLETKPEYRGMGLGSILIEKAINEMGGYWLHIEKPNIRVQSWYESLGFVMLDDNEDTYVKLMVLKNRIEDYNKLKERCNGDIKLMLGNLSRKVYKDLVDYETKPEVRTIYDEKGNIIKEEITDDMIETATNEYGHHTVKDVTDFTDKEAMKIVSRILIDTAQSPIKEESRRQTLEDYAQEPYHWGLFNKWKRNDELTILFSYDKKPSPDTGDWVGGFYLTEEEYEIILNAISPNMNEEIDDDMLDTVTIDLEDIRTKEDKQFIFDLLKANDFIIDPRNTINLLKDTINDNNSVWGIFIYEVTIPIFGRDEPEVRRLGRINFLYHNVGRATFISLDAYNRIANAVGYNSINVNEAKEDKERFSKWANDSELEQSFYDNVQRLDDKDVYSWMKKTPDDLRQAIKDLGTTNKEDREEAMKGAILVDENDYWKVYKVNTYEASKLLGKGTKWCISGDRVDNLEINVSAQSEEDAKNYINIIYDPDEIIKVEKEDDDSWDDIYVAEVKMPNGKYYFNHYLEQEDATYFFLISKPENKECFGDEKLNKIAIKIDGWNDVEMFDSQDNTIKEEDIPHYNIDKLL